MGINIAGKGANTYSHFAAMCSKVSYLRLIESNDCVVKLKTDMIYILLTKHFFQM